MRSASLSPSGPPTMTRLLSLACLLALLAAPASAQVSVGLGVAGGANFASLQDAGSIDLDRSIGYHVGLFADIGVPFVSTRAGVYYVDAGSFDGVATDDNSSAYVAIPVDVLFKTPTPLAQAYALVGPELRIPVAGLETFPESDYSVGANLGLGVRGGVPLIGPSGFVEARYGFDLTGLRDADVEEGPKVKVQMIQLRVGVGI